MGEKWGQLYFPLMKMVKMGSTLFSTNYVGKNARIEGQGGAGVEQDEDGNIKFYT